MTYGFPNLFAPAIVRSIKSYRENGIPVPLKYWTRGLASTNVSSGFNSALEDSSDLGVTVRLPGVKEYGTIFASGIVLQKNARVTGSGNNANFGTLIKPPSGSTDASVFEIPAGPIVDVYMADIYVQANGISGQHGAYIYAQNDGGGTGGLWESNFHRMTFDGFEYGWWSRGESGLTGTHPNQMTNWFNCYFLRQNSSTSRCFVATGQHGQIAFYSCNFDRPGGLVDGYAIELSREFLNGSTYGPRSIGGSAVAATGPGDFKINGGLIQNAKRGMYLDAAGNIICSAYGENLGTYVYLDGSSNNCWLEHTVCNNAANDSGTGALMYINGASCSGGLNGVRPAGTTDYTIYCASGGAWLKNDIITTGDQAGKASGLERQISASAGTLSSGMNQLLAVNASGGITLSTITSQINEVRIRSYQGDISYDTAGNIALASSPTVVAAGKIATLTRTDLGGAKWRITAVSP